jgi:hypothetical protein
MAKLTAAKRKALPNKTFAGPNRTFPIPDKNHAKAALALIRHAPPSARPKIRARAEAVLRSPHGSGTFQPEHIVQGYMPMNPAMLGMSTWDENQAAMTAPKKKKGGQ